MCIISFETLRYVHVHCIAVTIDHDITVVLFSETVSGSLGSETPASFKSDDELIYHA